jgi:hypothetical protein
LSLSASAPLRSSTTLLPMPTLPLTHFSSELSTERPTLSNCFLSTAMRALDRRILRDGWLGRSARSLERPFAERVLPPWKK